MSRKFVLLYLLLTLSAQIAFTQTIKNDKKTDELRQEAIAFLKETAVDVDNLRTLENRISLASEIASLMWFDDEKEAQTMFQKVIIDFRQMLTQIDAQYTSLDSKSAEDAEVMEDSSEFTKSKLQRKFGKAMSVRQQIALSIADHDPQMAYDFFTSTAQVVTNPELRAQFAEGDNAFEIKLIYALAEKDPDKALEEGRRRLAKGLNFEIIELLKKIYDKDADKGIAFGEEIVSKIKSDNSKAIDFYIFSALLNAGEENKSSIKNKTGKKPMFSDQSMRELADALGQEILKRDETEAGDVSVYVSQVEKYSPARGAQIRQKFKMSKTQSNSMATAVSEETRTADIMQTDAEKVADQDDFFSNTPSFRKQLSTEEKEKLVKESRAQIAKIKNREQKMMALTILASQMAFAGDKELAGEFMSEARNLVNLQPKNYKDYFGIWMLASAYAASDPDKAFPLLEDSISRLNETISAFVKVGEFIDVDEEMIEGEEIQVGGFGGGMTRDLLGMLGTSNATLHILWMTDFSRTKALTNRFDRLEVRILAKMLVLRALLGEKKVVQEQTNAK